jgi:hypothetical protein
MALTASICILLSAGCGFTSRAFTIDRTVQILSPRDQQTVGLPFSLTWTSRKPGQAYLIVFDAPPMAPHRPLLALVRPGDPCRNNPRCPDAAWLASHDMYVTVEPRLQVDHITDTRRAHSPENHTVTIVLLDQAGVRINEAAFRTSFTVHRRNS